MVQKVTTILIDDIDGGTASETVAFSLDRVAYEIDLSEEHAAQLREAMQEWVRHARRAAGTRGTRRSGRTRVDLTAVRKWGREHGYKVSDRGRVAQEIQDAYDKAHS